jgi:hypothetical protein
MPLEQVQFQVNIPQVLMLKYDEPKPCKNGSSMLSFDDGRVIFLEEPEAAEFARLGARKGDAVEFARQAVMNGKRIAKTQMKFRRVNGSGQPASPQAAKPEGEAARPAVAPVATPDANHRQSNMPAPSNGNGHAAHNGIPYWDSKTELLRCYADAIDVLVVARETAATKGLPVQFTGDDLRQVAATLYIDAGKDRRTPWQGR